MYSGDWLLRLSGALRERPSTRSRLPANVWGLGLTSLLTDMSAEMVVSILPAYLVLTGGVTPFVLGIATGLHEGGAVLGLWIGGLIADRSGRRKATAACGYALSAASRLGWLVFSTPTAAAVANLVIGDRLGKSVRTAPRDAIISLSVPPSRLATAFGVHRAMDAAGAAAGPLLAFALLWMLPRRYDIIFFTSFIAACLGLMALMLLVHEDPQRRTSRPSENTPSWTDGFAVIAGSPVRRVLVLAGAFGLVTISDAFIYLMLVQRSQVGAQWIPLLYTGTAVSFLVLAIPVGYLADRVGKRQTFIAGHVCLLLVYSSALGGFPAWPWNALVCVGLLGVFYAASDGVLAGLAGAALPVHVRSSGMAWVATAASGGRLCSAMLFGFLLTHAGDFAAVTTFAAALIVTIFIVTLAGLSTQSLERS